MALPGPSGNGALQRDNPLHISPSSFRRVSEFITRELGIRMSPAKIPLLQSRLQRRLRNTGAESLDAYLDSVLRSPDPEGELLEFIDAVTTNKTDFFREPQHFEFLTRSALPSLDEDPSRRWDVRAWSAGCSSGEEIYTLAMVLAEYGEERGNFDFQLVGTDISRRVLRAAETAIYEAELVAPVPMPLRQKYLLRSRDPARSQVRIAPALRSHASFQRLNFMAPRYDVPGPFDVIFFRNVMIYFDKPTQEQVVCRMCEWLRPGGYLFIGHSESLANLAVPLDSVGGAVYRKR